MSKMSKKIITIFLSLFLVGILSISCSNKDKTGAGAGSTTEKGIEQYNGNSYVSAESFTVSQSTVYLWVSVKDGQVGMSAGNKQTSEPQYQGYFPVTGFGTDYTFSTDYYGQPNAIKGTLKFSSDGSSVTVRYTENPELPENLLNKDIVCNRGNTETPAKGIEQYNGNSYVSTSAVMQSQYLWVSIKDSKVGMSAGNNQTSEPQYQGYFTVTGSGTDYTFSTDYYGQPNGIEGTLKFTSDGSTVTVNYSKNAAMSSIEGKDIVCNRANTETPAKGIEQYNGNKYVSENMGGNYLWISIENGLVAMTPNTDANTPPSFYGYMSGMSGYGTDYEFWSDDRSTEGTLKFASDGSTVTVTLTKNEPVPEAVGQAFVCYKK